MAFQKLVLCEMRCLFPFCVTNHYLHHQIIRADAMFTIRPLRITSTQYYSIVNRHFHRSILNILKHFKFYKPRVSSADLQENLRKDLLVAYKRGFRETAIAFRYSRKDKAVKWIMKFSVVLLGYGFLKFLYSLNNILSFPRPSTSFTQFFNRHNWLVPKESKLTFKDVIGCEEAKSELLVVVHSLTSPESFTRLGARPPRGVLLVGPPGVGKTMLGRAVAGEAKVTFLQVNGSEFDGELVGEGAQRVRELFAKARAQSPCIVFIDGVDAVCRRRADVANEPLSAQTTNQFLVEMDGLLSGNKKSGGVVVVLGATNQEELLDPAALRGGRFDMKIHVTPPAFHERLQLLEMYLGRVLHCPIPASRLEELAKQSAGMTGADIANVVNRAAIRAGLAEADSVTEEDLMAALDQVQFGLERGVSHWDQATRYAKAVHEAGHAVLARFTKDAPVIFRVTIRPGRENEDHGRTCWLPDESDRSLTRSQLLARLDVLLGGRIAEEELLGTENVSCNTVTDLQKASLIAIQMVRRFGMSACIGSRILPMPLEEVEDVENEWMEPDEDAGSQTDIRIRQSDISARMENQADAEVSRLLQESCKRARLVIRARLKELQRVVSALERYETLDAEDLSAVLIGGVPKAGVETESEAERNMTRWSNF